MWRIVKGHIREAGFQRHSIFHRNNCSVLLGGPPTWGLVGRPQEESWGLRLGEGGWAVGGWAEAASAELVCEEMLSGQDCKGARARPEWRGQARVAGPGLEALTVAFLSWKSRASWSAGGSSACGDPPAA